MIFHKVLDVLLSTWSHIAVLRVLQDSVHGLTGREIARQSGMNHRSCLRALTTLEELSIVRRIRGGRDHLFSINREHLLIAEGILPLLGLERKFFKEFTDVLKHLCGNQAETIILFGSVARREETAASDVDVCFLINKAADKEKIQDILQKNSNAMVKRFGARMSPIFFTRKEFSKKVEQKVPLVQLILSEGIIIKGKQIRRSVNATS
ncbi:MAG: nucleotidyltransferase domain-containing protein [bacterium]